MGKSALVIRLTTSQFVSSHDPTIEDQYHINLPVEGREASLDILDTAGQEDYSVMHDQWIREGHAFLILFSLDEQSTFENACKMRQKIERAKDSDAFPMVLVGNKADEPGREITRDQAETKAGEMGCPYLETSAKSGQNIQEAFSTLVLEVRKEKQIIEAKAPDLCQSLRSCCTIL